MEAEASSFVARVESLVAKFGASEEAKAVLGLIEDEDED